MVSGGLQSDQQINNLVDQIKDLQERMTQLERHALTSQNIQANKIALGPSDINSLADGDFASRGRLHNPIVAMGGVIGAYLSLPALRVFYPFTAAERDSTATQIKDLANGLDMTQHGCQFGWIDADLDGQYQVPVLNLGAASTDYADRADNAILNVSGSESNLISFSRGLTAGVWVQHIDFGTADESIFCQWDQNTLANRAWIIRNTSTPDIRVTIYDGTTTYTAIKTATVAEINNSWHFLCLQWSPAAYYDVLRIWVDDQYAEINPGATALNNSAGNLSLGADFIAGSPQRYFEGRLAMAFMCGCNIGGDTIENLYRATLPMFRPAEFG